jgi:DnaJ-class molecular chaperone
MTTPIIAPEPLCDACRGVGRTAGEQDDPCPWCDGAGRASAAKVRARRLVNLGVRLDLLRGHRDAAQAEADQLDRMMLQVEAQRAALIAEEGG